MKKMIVVLLFVNAVYACECMNEIDQIFEQAKEYIEEGLQGEIEAVYALMAEVSRDSAALAKQNLVIKKAVNAEKEKAKQNKEIIFLLDKLNNLQ